MTMNFQLCNDISCNDYDATAVSYVSLTDFRNIFKFKTTEISNNQLSDSALTDINSDITYYLNSSIFPDINPAHSMMDASGSEGIVYKNTSLNYNLLKHDFIYYWTNFSLGSIHLVQLLNNINGAKYTIEQIGWAQKESLETILLNADNSGNGLTNNGTNPDFNNLTKRILEQIKHFQPVRLETADHSQNDKIQNISTVQSVPLIEGDTINYFWTLTNSTAVRKYRIKLYLTNDTNNTNTIPIDSIANMPEYPDITSNGVPTV